MKKKTFQIGDTIKFTKRGISKYGIITSFVHPDGLYSDSYEKGYNGKDFLECIQILPRKGFEAQVRLNGKVSIFATPDNSKVCEVLPMDKNGGVRLNEHLN